MSGAGGVLLAVIEGGRHGMVGGKMKNGWTERIEELEAENRRLVALNDTLPQEIARLEDRVSEEYEAERADDRARIKELEAERDADRKREYGYSQQFDCLISIFHGLSSIFFGSRDS